MPLQCDPFTPDAVLLQTGYQFLQDHTCLNARIQPLRDKALIFGESQVFVTEDALGTNDGNVMRACQS